MASRRPATASRRPATAGRRHNSATPPVRTCIGCRRTATVDELVRVALDEDGNLAVGRGTGRGAWLCATSPGCLDEAVRRKAFSRALRTDVSDQAVARLRACLQEHGKIRGSVIDELTERKG